MIWRRFIGGDRTAADLVNGQGIYILSECCGNSLIAIHCDNSAWVESCECPAEISCGA